MTNYETYKNEILNNLPLAIGKYWADGKWTRTGDDKAHILPLEDSNKSASKLRAEAMKKYLGIDIAQYLGPKLKGLHQYSHHLNSSQTLCIQFFSALIEGEDYEHLHAKNELVELLKSIGITIHKDAQCKFEYTENDQEKYLFKIHNSDGNEVIEYEGTSFDFHIKDNNVEVFFEIKFTENGFGKASKDKKHPERDKRHTEKAEQYKNLLPSYLTRKPTTEEVLRFYQLFRNITRVAENKYVVFITDENNPATEKEKKIFKDIFGESDNVIFLTWQQISEKAESLCLDKLPFQFNVLNKVR